MAATPLQRRRLGLELRALREAARLTAQEAGQHIGRSHATISNIERGKHRVTKTDLSALLELYDATPELRALLHNLRSETPRRGWWATYRLPSWFETYVGFESEAALVREFELELVPGLMQTPGYARAVHVVGSHLTAPDEVGPQVAARLQRQRRLFANPPLTLHAVVSEAAVRRVVGGRKTMAEQLEHVLELAELDNVRFQVLPFAAGEHASMAGTMVLLRFPEKHDADLAYIDHALGGHMIDSPYEVATLGVLLDALQDAALSTRKSRELVESILEELRRA
ncbi:helix-turn-helix domain-containing protein [Longimycelium tulufanense]|nr:helix-turn-helix transcriptional regulator [Longimycelium tulufanense]